MDAYRSRHRSSGIALGMAASLAGAMAATLLSFQAAQAASGTWASTGSMSIARQIHTATFLPSGKVLVAGGVTPGPGTAATAELYDPVAGTWSLTASMSTARSRHTATLLPTGKVLVAGGRLQSGLSLATAELYDPQTGTWVPTGRMGTARDNFTATLLSDGIVLVAGGVNGTAQGNPIEKSAEIYDPQTGSWSVADKMGGARFNHRAVLLASGKVLVSGGSGPAGDCIQYATAELYDPQANRWTSIDPMSEQRGVHAAALLQDGRALVAGGFTQPANCVAAAASAEIYDPGTGRWSPTGSLAGGRGGIISTVRLADGRLLVTGGRGATGQRLATAELYIPASGTWISAGSMAAARAGYAITLLADGRVLVAGGGTPAGLLASAELYTP